MKYPSRTLVKNINPVARTLSEATRDARYACAIQTFKSDTKLAIEFMELAFIGGLWTFLVLGSIGGLVYWVFN